MSTCGLLAFSDYVCLVDTELGSVVGLEPCLVLQEMNLWCRELVDRQTMKLTQMVTARGPLRSEMIGNQKLLHLQIAFLPS